MRITTTWASDPNGDDMPWLVAAYDEYTADAWNGTPDFYTREVENVREGVLRECVIYVPDQVIEDLFNPSFVTGDLSAEVPQ